MEVKKGEDKGEGRDGAPIEKSNQNPKYATVYTFEYMSTTQLSCV